MVPHQNSKNLQIKRLRILAQPFNLANQDQIMRAKQLSCSALFYSSSFGSLDTIST